MFGWGETCLVLAQLGPCRDWEGGANYTGRDLFSPIIEGAFEEQNISGFYRHVTNSNFKAIFSRPTDFARGCSTNTVVIND